MVAARPTAEVAARLTAQLLAGVRARDPEAVAGRLLAIQGQDPRGARLAIRARSDDLSAAGVDRALTEDRSLVISWPRAAMSATTPSARRPRRIAAASAASSSTTRTLIAQMIVVDMSVR